jgi:hypothetical protein
MYQLKIYFKDAKTFSSIKGFETSIAALQYFETLANKAMYLGIIKQKQH